MKIFLKTRSYQGAEPWKINAMAAVIALLAIPAMAMQSRPEQSNAEQRDMNYSRSLSSLDVNKFESLIDQEIDKRFKKIKKILQKNLGEAACQNVEGQLDSEFDDLATHLKATLAQVSQESSPEEEIKRGEFKPLLYQNEADSGGQNTMSKIHQLTENPPLLIVSGSIVSDRPLKSKSAPKERGNLVQVSSASTTQSGGVHTLDVENLVQGSHRSVLGECWKYCTQMCTPAPSVRPTPPPISANPNTIGRSIMMQINDGERFSINTPVNMMKKGVLTFM